MVSFTKPIGRLAFTALGVVLFGVKIGLDWLVTRAYAGVYSVLFYVSPMDSPLFNPKQSPGYWLALWGVALPFISVGFMLTLRRLRDAGLPAGLAAMFFVPFANLLFFVACAIAPSRPEPVMPSEPSAYRESARSIELPRPPRSFGSAVLLAGLLGAVIGLGAIGVSVGLLKTYGSGLLLGAPVVSSFAATLFFCRLHPPTPGGAALTTVVSFVISFAVVIGFAIEGLGCLVMALPLLVIPAGMGSVLGYGFGCALRADRARWSMSGAAIFLLPVTFAAERASPIPEPSSDPVESEIVVDAPPEIVWKRVLAFPPLAPPTEAIFRAGIAAPLSANIEGEGVGAVRRCHFTTGDFVEPIEVWRPGRELTFTVSSQPDPMLELTLYGGPRPPHLDGYLQSTRGQFLLEPVPGGKTRLVGRTWYRTHMTPEGYWRFWGDAILHRIHMRVLAHVAALAEADARHHALDAAETLGR